MRKIILALFAAFVLTSVCASGARAAVTVDIQSLTSILAYNHNAGKFLGEFSMTIFGIPAGEVVIAIDGPDGKQVFEQRYPCSKGYGDEPQCYIDTSPVADAIKPFEETSGQHTLRMSYKGEQVFSMKFNFKVVEQYGSKNTYVTGPWDALAAIQLSGQPAARAAVFSGSPELCDAGKGADTQLFLTRDGAYVAHGHLDGYYYESCSTTLVSFPLFHEDKNHFTRWLTANEVLDNSGDYEMKYFRDGALIKTYGFTVAEGKITSKPPSSVDPGVLPEHIHSTPQDVWIYQK